MVSRMYHPKLKAKLTSSFILLVLHDQRMSETGSCDLDRVAYLFGVYNDVVFIRRLSVGLVDDLGDAFAHDNDND